MCRHNLFRRFRRGDRLGDHVVSEIKSFGLCCPASLLAQVVQGVCLLLCPTVTLSFLSHACFLLVFFGPGFAVTDGWALSRWGFLFSVSTWFGVLTVLESWGSGISFFLCWQ